MALLKFSQLALLVWECSKDHCWKQRYTADTLCTTCAAIRRYVHPATLRPTMRPRSNGRIAKTGARYLGQSIAGWHSAPSLQFGCEDTGLRCRQRRLNYTLMWLFGHPLEHGREKLLTYEKRKKGWRMNCDVGEATEVFENELWRR